MDWPDARTLGVVLFPRFGLLDVAGPLAAFGALKNMFEPLLVAAAPGPVESAQGPALLAVADFDSAPDLPLLLVPGGIGARQAATDEVFLAWLADRAARAELLLAVGTGSALLALTGRLEGRRATSAARGMDWARAQGPGVRWEVGPRWVDDGDVVTAAGPAAGLDMALHVITRLTAPDVGENVARSLEHVWSRTSAGSR
jgi:transcriptional regulator GlxA family with amidase domain